MIFKLIVCGVNFTVFIDKYSELHAMALMKYT